MPKRLDLSGKKFGLLTALSLEGSDGKQTLWLCKCDCGKFKTVKRDNLQKGSTRSCGCLALEQRKKAAQGKCHEYSSKHYKRERRAWHDMLSRCYSPKHSSFLRYSSNGIFVCETWRKSFVVFILDMGRCPLHHTLERVDNVKGYYPENCKWASYKEQSSNKSSNVWIKHNNQTKTIRQWEEHFGWNKGVINNRLYLGWSIEKALNTPVVPRKTKRHQLA